MATNDKVTLIKVTLEYSDGRVSTLTGDEAQAWITDVNDIIVMSSIRGHGLQKHKWEESNK